jgi:H+/gluconate symporter-like permease
MGIVGIAIGMFLLIFLVYKGMSNIYVAPICAVIVALFNGMPLLPSLLEHYLGGVGGWMVVGFSFALVGAIFGKVYETTGAASAIGSTLMRVFSPKSAKHDKKKTMLMGLITVTVLQVLLTWTGMSGIVVLLTSFPIAFSIAKSCDIPRKFIPTLVMCPGATAAMAGPGAPTIGNLTASSILGTSVNSALIPGIIGALFVIVCGNFYIYKTVCRAFDKGEHFEDLGKYVQLDENLALPKFWVAIVPLLIVFVTFAIIQLHVLICLALGIAAALLLMYKNVPGGTAKDVFQMLNAGAASGGNVYFTVASLMGFANVVQKSNGFQVIIDMMRNMPGSPLVVATLAVVIFVLFTSSPPAAISLGLTAYVPDVNAGTLSGAAIHRTAVFATTTFESMPYSGAAILTMQLSGVSHKEGYIPVFVVTVLIPLIATGIVTLILTIFPGLA